METTRSNPRRRIVAFAVTATLALAACGDDDEPELTEPESTVAPTESESTAPGGSEDTTVEPSEPAASDPATSGPATTGPQATGDALSAEEWRAEFDQLCDAARDAGNAIEEPLTVGDFDESIDAIIDTGDTLFEDAAQLTPPAELQQGAANLASLWDDQRGKFEEVTVSVQTAYDEDQIFVDIPEAELEELVGDALDQTALTEQAEELGLRCFNAGN